MTQQQHFDIIINGGGMVGLAQALACALDGLKIAVIEQTPFEKQLAPTFDGRVSAIALASQRLFKNIGAWDAMQPHACAISDIRVTDNDSLFFLHYDCEEVGDEPFGWIIENRYIRNALKQAVEKNPNITLLAPDRIKSFAATADAIHITLANDDVLQARLLIGADGKSSSVRKAANIGSVDWPYAQTAIVCTIAHTLPHQGLAQERFLPAGPFAVLPMQNNRSSLVWVEPTDRVQMYLKLSDAEFLSEIRERVGDYLGELSLIGPRFSYPLSLMHAKQYTAERVCLIGDAAHGIHPIAGQGVNLGFRDVAALADLISAQAKLGLDIGSAGVLEKYQRLRRFDNISMLTITDLLTRLFSNRILPLQFARRFGLWGVSKLPPLKRVFMKHAMGTSGETPRLMKAM